MDKEQIISFEIRGSNVILFSTESVHGPYPVETFLCEIFENLCKHFELNDACNNFFNYADPHGAWILLSDFFKRTDNLKNASLEYFDNYRSKYDIATVYKGNIIKNLIMDCQSYTKYRPNETTGGIFVSWRRKEELPTGA